MLYIDNYETGENAWILTGEEPIREGGGTGKDEDRSQTEFVECFDTTTVSH